MKLKTAITPYILFLFIAIIGSTTQGCSPKKTENVVVNGFEIPGLLPRTNALSQAVEWQKTQTKVTELTEKIAAKPQDTKPRIQLATIYMAEARITGDSYYHQAAVKLLNSVLEIEPNNLEANTFKASVAMSLHQFGQARTIAQKALQLNPYSAYVYGVLVDANIELGNYTEAVAMSDKMQQIKPSLESYARASYLREIFGENQGAIAAMKLAVIAGGTGSESAEWSRVTLGDLFLNNGKLDSAENAYRTSLVVRPNFATAYIGLAKVAKARKNYAEAIKNTESAIKIMSEASYVSLLGELYALSGNKEKAKSIRNDVVELLEKGEKEKTNSKDIVMAHNANRELANAYLENNQLNKALDYALLDVKIRPQNIDANELVAWIYYLKQDYKNAEIYSGNMLKTGTSNANTLYKAGLIAKKLGQTAQAEMYTKKALAVNPTIDAKILQENAYLQ